MFQSRVVSSVFHSLSTETGAGSLLESALDYRQEKKVDQVSYRCTPEDLYRSGHRLCRRFDWVQRVCSAGSDSSSRRQFRRRSSWWTAGILHWRSEAAPDSRRLTDCNPIVAISLIWMKGNRKVIYVRSAAEVRSSVRQRHRSGPRVQSIGGLRCRSRRPC